MLGTCFCGIYPAESSQKSAVWLLLSFILYKMKKPWLIISKDWIRKHYEKQFNQLKTMFWDDWYLYQYYTTYYLAVWECETSFISMKLDFASIVDWIEFGILASKHVKK